MRTRVIETFPLFQHEEGFREGNGRNTDLYNSINNITLNDGPYESPWKNDEDERLLYLTTSEFKSTEISLNPNKNKLISMSFHLSDNIVMRSRSVYNLVDMIAEVSGLADILIIFSKAVMALLFTRRMLQSTLVRSIG
jgi:hypothetical protein